MEITRLPPSFEKTLTKEQKAEVLRRINEESKKSLAENLENIMLYTVIQVVREFKAKPKKSGESISYEA